MNLHNLDHHFCEGKIIGEMPELLNSYSSLFISLFSLHGIFINKLNNDGYFQTLKMYNGGITLKGNLNEHSTTGLMINKVKSKLLLPMNCSISNIEKSISPNKKLIYIHLNNSFTMNLMYYILFITGIGSFGYHWTEQLGWAFMDEMPMIISLFIGIIYVEHTLFVVKKQSLYNILCLVNSEVHSKLKQLVLTSFMVFSLVGNTSITQRKWFPYYFAVALVYFSYTFWVAVSKFANTEYFTTFNDDRIHPSSNIIYLGKTCLCLLWMSVVIWAITELSCNYTHNYILLVGHPLWHFLIGYVFYNIIQIIYYINLYHQYMVLEQIDNKNTQNHIPELCERSELHDIDELCELSELHLTYNSYYLLTITYNTHKCNM